MLLNSLLASSLAVTSTVNAPESDPKADEILITGERAPRALRETSSSVVLFSEDMIEGASAERLDQVLALVPNVQAGSGEEGPAIRGQDSTGVLRNLFAFLGGTRPRVTVQIDGRPVTYYEYVASSAPTWEVERIEVFRSPQTTTQGRNSIAGAIFIETSDPVYEWRGRGRIVGGDFHTRQASAALSAPIVADQLAISVAGDVRLSRMASDMADGISGADIDRDDYGIVRVKTLFEPKAAPSLRIEASYVHTQSKSPQFEAVMAPFRERRFPVPERTNGVHRVKVDSLTARVGYRLDPNIVSTMTLSAGAADIRRFGLPGLGLTSVDSNDYSAEATVRWQRDNRLSVLAGGHHLATRQRQSIDITGLGIGAGSFRDRQESLGLFGEASWRPAAPLAVTGGLRYQRDAQRRFGGVGNPPIGIALDYVGRFDAWLPKLSISYDIDPDVTAGVLVQRAYNPGGTSISLARRAEDRFEAETLWNYEGFVRSSFAGGRARFAANLFYNSIENAQRQQLVPVIAADGGTLFAVEFANAPKARTYGAEAELSWRVGPRLSLRAAAGLLRTRVVRTILATDPTIGKDFQRSPRFSASGAIDWRPLDPLRLSAQVRHHSGYFSDDANTSARRVESATIVDLRSAYTRGRVTLFGYLRNALDAFALNYLFTPTFGTAEDPREFGAGLEFRF